MPGCSPCGPRGPLRRAACARYERATYAPGMARVFVAANKNDHEIEYRLHDDMLDMVPVVGGTKVWGGVVIPPETCAVLVDA